MKKIIAPFLMLVCMNCISQDSFQLAKPLVKYESVFFKDSAKIELKFAQPGARIYYTLDNSTPTEKSILYKRSIVVSKHFTTIKAKVFCDGFLPSETVEYSFAKEGKKIKRTTATAPNQKYPGSGDYTLFDNKGGFENISSKTWMGFDGDTVLINIELAEKQIINEVLLNFLQNQSSWIFLPRQIQIEYFDEVTQRFRLYRKEEYFVEAAAPAACVIRKITIPKPIIRSDKLKVTMVTVNKIPDWHSGKGQHAWCFIDEIKVY